MAVKFDSSFFLRVRRRALRKGVWFRVLTCEERAILSLVPMCMEKPRSSKLIDMLAKIVVKIKDALRSSVVDVVSQVGRPLAKKLSEIAHRWGHRAAAEWAADEGFARYLGIIKLNGNLAYCGGGVL